MPKPFPPMCCLEFSIGDASKADEASPRRARQERTWVDGSLPCSLVGTGDGGGGSDYLHQCTRTCILASEQDFCLSGAFSPNTVCACARAHACTCAVYATSFWCANWGPFLWDLQRYGLHLRELGIPIFFSFLFLLVSMVKLHKIMGFLMTLSICEYLDSSP